MNLELMVRKFTIDVLNINSIKYIVWFTIIMLLYSSCFVQENEEENPSSLKKEAIRLLDPIASIQEIEDLETNFLDDIDELEKISVLFLDTLVAQPLYVINNIVVLAASSGFNNIRICVLDNKKEGLVVENVFFEKTAFVDDETKKLYAVSSIKHGKKDDFFIKITALDLLEHTLDTRVFHDSVLANVLELDHTNRHTFFTDIWEKGKVEK